VITRLVSARPVAPLQTWEKNTNETTPQKPLRKQVARLKIIEGKTADRPQSTEQNDVPDRYVSVSKARN
jgi:hypothetical protein